MAWEAPPRCLAGYDVSPFTERSATADLLDDQACFRVTCKCGSSTFRVSGYTNTELPTHLLGPLSTECEPCRTRNLLFDPLVHGYDGEIQMGRSFAIDEKARGFVCPWCSGSTFALLPTFSYELESDDLDAQQSAHAQDFFDWFKLTVQCQGCNHACTAAECECA